VNKQQQLNSRTSDTNMLLKKKEIQCLVHRRRNYASWFTGKMLAQSSLHGCSAHSDISDGSITVAAGKPA
jgi:hypothetical protein